MIFCVFFIFIFFLSQNHKPVIDEYKQCIVIVV